MNAINSFRQFVKEGLVGVAIALVIGFGPPILFISAYEEVSFLFNFIVSMFFFPKSDISPMPFVMLTAFIGAGIGGWFLERIVSRIGWLKNSFLVVVSSWLAGIGAFTIFFIARMLITPEFPFNQAGYYFYMQALLYLGGFGAIISLVVGSLAGAIFDPGERFDKVMIAAIVSAIMGLSIGLGILLPQISID